MRRQAFKKRLFVGPLLRPWSGAGPYRTIREYATELILRVDRIDVHGRFIGFDYEHIRAAILAKFPVVTYPGPHRGKPTRMTYKELHEMACGLNRDGVRLPVRPRRKVYRIKTGELK